MTPPPTTTHTHPMIIIVITVKIAYSPSSRGQRKLVDLIAHGLVNQDSRTGLSFSRTPSFFKHECNFWPVAWLADCSQWAFDVSVRSLVPPQCQGLFLHYQAPVQSTALRVFDWCQPAYPLVALHRFQSIYKTVPSVGITIVSWTPPAWAFVLVLLIWMECQCR